MPIKEFIEVVPQYPLPIKIYAKEDYYTWPAVMMKEKGFKAKIVTLLLAGQKKREIIDRIEILRFSNPIKLYLYLLSKKRALVYAQGKIVPLFSSFFSSRAAYVTHATMGKMHPRYLSVPHLRFVYKSSLAQFKKVIAISPYETSLLKKYKFKQNFVCVPNAIDCKFFEKPSGGEKFRAKYQLNKSLKIVTFLGNMHKGDKTNIETLFKAFKLVLKANFKAKLIVIGQFPPKIKKIKEYLSVSPSTIFTGWLPHTEFIKAFDITDVFANTSRSEGNPLSVAEAASAKIPLCLAALPTLKSTYKNTVLYHDPEDYQKLAKNIIEYLQNPGLREKKSISAYKMIKATQDIPCVQKAIWDIFKEILNQR